ncbi:alpha/beta hydrolase [Mucilaginibacter panaciglaebae]|uniref:AB hydrolase-1 domain-containing protein n=1 Tax=Mucilaginibacter panaciglaebae TaxID=502331 RepID=A0ABP7X136_9SPHI
MEAFCFVYQRKVLLLIAGLVSGLVNPAQATPVFKDTLVTVGNHKLYVVEQGPQDSKLTIVFESGAGGTSQDWVKVKALLPDNLHTVAYDRAGSGKSEAGPLPRTMAQEVLELHKLLKAIGTKGNVILVAQSLGGLLVRLYTERYGNNVAGIVLVDPTHESSVLGSMKYGGWVRLREKATGKPIPQPQLKLTVSPGYDTTADYMAEEFQKIYLAAQRHPQQLGNRPLVIIGAGIRSQPPGTPDEQWKQLRAERDEQLRNMTSLSSNAKFILDAKSSHNIQNDNPQVVMEAIKTIIDQIHQ